jgi:hypothetical protein
MTPHSPFAPPLIRYKGGVQGMGSSFFIHPKGLLRFASLCIARQPFRVKFTRLGKMGPIPLLPTIIPPLYYIYKGGNSWWLPDIPLPLY